MTGGSGGGGGRVGNAAPTVPSMSADRAAGDNGGGFVVTFSGEIADPNAERDLASVKVTGTGPAPVGSAAYAIPQNRPDAEPAEFDPTGYKVWDAQRNDGKLQFRYRQTFAAFTLAGSYDFVATATDKDGASGSGTPARIALASFSLISVGPAPIRLDGTQETGSAWGGWSAQPGATNVPATNYIMLTNNGDKPDVRVVVDFTEASFRGAEDGEHTIPIDRNVQFAWFEDTSPATTSPAEGTFDFQPASTDGSVTVSFAGKGNVAYVGYRLVQLPPLLAKQSYSASFTVTEL